MSDAVKTRDHDEIREWVEARDGQPSAVRDTGNDGDPGILRIDFPGGSTTDRLEHIDWDEWFAKFDGENLAFLYQDQKADGSPSTFCKIVNADEAA